LADKKLDLVNKTEPELTNEWAERCIYWNNFSEANKPKRKRREKQSQPLVLTGHGLSLRVDKGRLVIKDGLTHFPSKPAEAVFFKGGLDLPPRIVIVDGNGNITLDALDWMQEQSIDLIRLRYNGRVQSVFSANGYAADPKKVDWQRETRASERARVKYAIPLIRKKIQEALFNLENLLPDSPSRTKAIETAKAALAELKASPPASVSKLHGLEGLVAQGYFFAWRALDIQWKSTKRHPVPDEWKTFFSRSSLKWGDRYIQNQHATHPINAMLNYAYALLESEVRIRAVADGYDPSIGIMHDRISPDRHSFVFDHMEPLRPVADRRILELIRTETFSGADFDLQSDGVVRVNPELVRRVVSLPPIN
jgi:CRISPR-associated protein Cas1